MKRLLVFEENLRVAETVDHIVAARSDGGGRGELGRGVHTCTVSATPRPRISEPRRHLTKVFPYAAAQPASGLAIRCARSQPQRVSTHNQPVSPSTELSDRRKLEEDLVATVKELRDVKAALDEHSIVAITDSTGRITYVNDKFCAISK